MKIPPGPTTKEKAQEFGGQFLCEMELGALTNRSGALTGICGWKWAWWGKNRLMGLEMDLEARDHADCQG